MFFKPAKGVGWDGGRVMKDIHFGRMILDELNKQRYSVAWFAKEMGSTRANMYKILKKPHLNTDFVLRAALLLHQDFFRQASEILILKSENDRRKKQKTDNNN